MATKHEHIGDEQAGFVFLLTLNTLWFPPKNLRQLIMANYYIIAHWLILLLSHNVVQQCVTE